MARVKFRQNCKGKMPDGKGIYASECDMPDREAKKFVDYAMADLVTALSVAEPNVATEVVDAPENPSMRSRKALRVEKR